MNLRLFYLKGRLLCLLLLLLGGVSLAQQSVEHVNKLLQREIALGEITATDALDWTITSEHTSSTSKVHHIYFRQQLDGIEIYGAEGSVHITPDGRSISNHHSFVRNAARRQSGITNPSITAAEAIDQASRQLGYGAAAPVKRSQEGGISQAATFSLDGISKSIIPVKLMYVFTEKEGLRLVWDLSIQATQENNWWNVRVDAATGMIIEKNDWIVQCVSEENHTHDLSSSPGSSAFKSTAKSEMAIVGNYEVYAMPTESPGHGDRTIVTNPEDGTVLGSPFGWHDTDGVSGAEFTTTRGNNVRAYDDGDNAGYSPDGGADLLFSGTGFEVNTNYSNADQSENAAITNLFYWSNIIHDILYVYGMDEAAGNFQDNTYGNEGLGNDGVNAEAQDGSGTCNANFGTPPDGNAPTMQMFVCNNRDGDFDNAVIVHEYGHGISIRLTGGGSNSGCLVGEEQMGEGWSDWYGTVLTIEPGDVGTGARGIGTWLVGQGPDGPGIRDFPYSTDLSVDPRTYDAIKTAAVPHGVGSTWAAMLWEVTWSLIDTYGFDEDIYNFTGDVSQDAGNVQAMAIVTEGLKLQPCGPGFVDGRDAILAADLALYGGANYCAIWEAFAKRGLGFSASQGTSSSRNDGVEAFDIPETAFVVPGEEVCVSEGIQIYGGGLPIGGTYSGNGVTDNGDGETYTFDPSVTGIGTITVNYEATAPCGTSNTATTTIEVTSEVPEIACQDATYELGSDGTVALVPQDIVTTLLPAGYVIDQSGTFDPIDISASGTSVSLTDDDVSNALAIGFEFSFYEQAYTQFYISSNGFITFTPTNEDGCCSGNFIPTPGGNADNYIAFAWEDVNPQAGGIVRYQTVGEVPNRILVMEFDGVPFWNTNSFITAQVQLYEGSNRIEIHSTSIPADGNTTQGIENADGTEGIATPGRNSETWSATNDYVAFVQEDAMPGPSCGSETTLTFSQEVFTTDDVGDVLVTATITDANGNSNSCEATVTIINTLGVEDAVLDAALTLYPNPVQEMLTIDYKGAQMITEVAVYDITGKVLLQDTFTEATNNYDISTSTYATGVYFVRITTESASIVRRVVKR